MHTSNILVERSGAVMRVTLNRPERMNSFTVEMHAELRTTLDSLQHTADPPRVLVITGAGRAFCSGQDLNERVRMLADGEVDLGASIDEWYAPLILRLRALPIPIIAAVNGVAAGAGSSLALACDLVIATRSATFIQSFGKVGLIPDCGGTWLLPRIVGRARAVGLARLADRVSAEEAKRIGLIWRCVPDDQFSAVAEQTSLQLASAPPRALAAMKLAFDASDRNTLHQQLQLGRSADYREGVAAFAQKRPPRFTGQ